MAKKAATKASKPMSRKGMKKTKGGLIGLLKPATLTIDSPRDPAITGNTITGNNTISGNNTLNGGTLPNTTFSGGV